jgi:hypothetical protein
MPPINPPSPKIVPGSTRTAAKRPTRPLPLPKPSKPRGQPATVRQEPATDFVALGQAVALAQLAEAEGMDVPGVAAFPEKLGEAGLPAPCPRIVVERAQGLFRDARDALLWRGNGHLRDVVERASLADGGLSSAVNGAVERIKAGAAKDARLAAEAKARLDDLHRRKEAERESTVPPAPTAKEPATTVKLDANGSRAKVMGHSAYRVCCWMGKHGWTVSEAVRALRAFGSTLPEKTAAHYLREGGTPKGKPAELTEEQAAELERAAGRATAAKKPVVAPPSGKGNRGQNQVSKGKKAKKGGR